MIFSGCWGYLDQQDSQEISLTLTSLSVRGLDFKEIVPQTELKAEANAVDGKHRCYHCTKENLI